MNIRYPIYEGVYRILTFYFASPAFIQAKPYSLFTIIFTGLFRSPLCRCRPVCQMQRSAAMLDPAA